MSEQIFPSEMTLMQLHHVAANSRYQYDRTRCLIEITMRYKESRKESIKIFERVQRFYANEFYNLDVYNIVPIVDILMADYLLNRVIKHLEETIND